MNILLDSHILIWALSDDPRLSDAARRYIMDPENCIYYSAVSLWELTLKHMMYPQEITFTSAELIAYCEEAGFAGLDLTPEDVTFLETLNRPKEAPRHKDPFDRMLICQAKAEGMIFLTHDGLLSDYNEQCVVMV